MKKGKIQNSFHDSELLNTKQGDVTITPSEGTTVEISKLKPVNAKDNTTPTQSIKTRGKRTA